MAIIGMLLAKVSNILNKFLYDGPEYGFDRAISKDMDNTVGDLRKRSKSITANAANDEVFALAA